MFEVYDIEGLIKDFKIRVAKDGILRELKRRRYFQTRIEKRREKDRVALSRMKRKDLKRWRWNG
jgi:ribosomal protein S21